MKSTILACCTAALILSSCSKEESEPCPEPASYNTAEYTQLAVGNYWVYQGFIKNIGDSVFTQNMMRDSIYIAQDTLINNKTYYWFKGGHFGLPDAFSRIARVEGSQLLDQYGNSLLDVQAVSDTVSVQPGWISIIDSVADVNSGGAQLINTMAGPVTSAYWHSRVLYMQSPFPSPQLEEEFYLQGIGIGMYTATFASSGTPIELRLDNYLVQ